MTTYAQVPIKSDDRSRRVVHSPDQDVMTDSKEAPFFNLPPLPAQTTGTSTGSAEKQRDKTGSRDKLSKEGKAGEPIAAIPTKPAPNLGTFKALIAITWLLFIACVAGLVYVIIRYKIDRDELKTSPHIGGP